MDVHVVLYICDRWITGCVTPHLIDKPEVVHVAPLLPLHWRYLKDMFDGSQSRSFEIVMCQHVSTSSSVGYRVINSHVDTTINIGLWILKSASITSVMFWLVGSLRIGIPRAQHWLGFIKVFSILFPNHKPWPNLSITTSPDYIYIRLRLYILGYLPVQNIPLVKVRPCTLLM